jgi:hypothetical protein
VGNPVNSSPQFHQRRLESLSFGGSDGFWDTIAQNPPDGAVERLIRYVHFHVTFALMFWFRISESFKHFTKTSITHIAIFCVAAVLPIRQDKMQVQTKA